MLSRESLFEEEESTFSTESCSTEEEETVSSSESCSVDDELSSMESAGSTTGMYFSNAGISST